MRDVAIIVPIYNVEKYVKKCLESLILQTYKHIKIYAIIDGSPDNSVEIVKKMQSVDDRIVCIEKENGGYGSVLEYAINNISEEFFVICDPDDWMEKNEIEVLYNAAMKDELDIVVADKYLVYTDSDDPVYSSSNKKNIVKENLVYSASEIRDFFSLRCSPHSKMYRTSILKGIKFPYKVSYTDYYLYYYALSKAKKCMYINEALSYYLIDREGNTSTDKTAKSFHSHVVVFRWTLNEFRNTIDNQILLFLYDDYIHLFIIYSRLSELEKRKVNYQDYDELKDMRNFFVSRKKDMNGVSLRGLKVRFKFILCKFLSLRIILFIFNILIKIHDRRR